MQAELPGVEAEDPTALGESRPPDAGPVAPPLATLVIVTLLGPFSIHMMLPLLPSIAQDINSDYAAAQLTVTTFLIGISVAQLIYGSWSDRIGRRPILIGGLGLYAAASAACALAPTIQFLMVARFLQAVGSSAGIVVSRAILRDCLDRSATASAMGYLTMTMSVCSLAAPAFGALFLATAGWRASFWFLFGLGLVALAVAMVWIFETKPDAQKSNAFMAVSYGYNVFSSRAFFGYTLSSAFNMSSWYMLITALPYILSTVLDRSEMDFAYYLPMLLVAYILGNFITGRFARHIGPVVAWLGMALTLLGATGFWIWHAFLPDTIWTVLAPMLIVVAGSGVLLPNLNAGAVSARPNAVGAASGLLGFLQMMVCAGATLLLARLYNGTMLPILIALSMAIAASALCLVLTLNTTTAE